MARPFKQGLSYFPLDVDFFNDPKIIDIRIEHGYLAELVYIRILALVYANGYYLEMSVDQLAKTIFRNLQGERLRKADRISDIIRSFAMIALLDSGHMKNDVITSLSIQKQWLTSVARRKNIDKSKYWLLTSEDEAGIKKSHNSYVFSPCADFVNENKNGFNVDNNLVNDDISTQKENKKDKDKKINKDKRVFDEPKLHFITNSLIKNKYIDADDLSIGKFNLLFKSLVDEYGFDIVLSVSDYIVKISKKEHIEIHDRYEYFKTSAKRNASILESNMNKEGFNIEKELKEIIKRMD